ncbi:SWIM zinc finger domain-containing protein [Microbispora sp. H13382]|uniref:SWIM zinc finger family protein n=1 Tax=Microbispora sp. H13382 TaxID=2729112 RepID=UPI001604295B|nr:DUF6880 family protein [Microbispora sp. H13382]
MTGFTKDDLRALAGAKSYDRGVDYVDAVEDLQVDGGKIFATVYGTEPYEVELTVGRRGLDGACDCPWGQEGNFCKHCVAVGLVYLFQRERGEAVPDRFDLRSYLTSLDSQELVALLMELAEGDRNIRRRLEARAADDPVGAVDAQNLRERIDRMLRVRGHVGWDGSWDYADTIGGIADELERLLQAGQSAATASLAQRAMERVAENYEFFDDSDGQIGEASRVLVAVHAAACTATGGDPVALASWLLQRQLGDADVPELSIDDYADALGEAGVAAYGEQLRRIWEKRSPRTGWRTDALMREYARARGDIDLLVTVLGHGGRPDYPGIVEVLTEAERDREALEWAERGLAAADGAYDRRLTDFAATAHAAAGRGDEALALRRAQFERDRSLTVYQVLHAAATPDHWPELRAWALELLRQDASTARRGPSAWQPPSMLVDVLLWENSNEEAWQAAVEFGAVDGQWSRLARLRAEAHPADAIPVYERLADSKISLMKNDAYAEAADLVAHITKLYDRLGREADGRAYVERLRITHKRKRNFMAELQRRGL